MEKAKIFLIDDEGKNIKEMVETPYKTEDVLQRLLVLKPDLLPGNQLNPENPRRWILVKQEMGVPDSASTGDRWSIDHLFLDQDGVPTFVECKRASDTRNRREVVAQMLDYAANGLEYWGMDRLRQAAAESARDDSRTLETLLMELIGSDGEEEIEGFWNKVEENLREGRVRLLFVADEIPKELRRLVEFLNEKMSDVEVVAVEVKQFLGDGQRAVVPRAIGLTERIRVGKPGGNGKRRTINREEFIATCTPDAAKVFDRVLNDAAEKGYVIYFGTKGFSVRARVANEDREYASFLYGWPPNEFEIYLAQLPLSEEQSLALRKQFLELGIFKEAGDWTLRASVDTESTSNIGKSCDIIFKKMEEIIKSERSV